MAEADIYTIEFETRSGEEAPLVLEVYSTNQKLTEATSQWNNSREAEGLMGSVSAHENKFGKVAYPIILRLSEESLGLEVVSHEVHHAVTAMYAASVTGSSDRADEHLTHYNEEFAFLYSDVLSHIWEMVNN